MRYKVRVAAFILIIVIAIVSIGFCQEFPIGPSIQRGNGLAESPKEVPVEDDGHSSDGHESSPSHSVASPDNSINFKIPGDPLEYTKWSINERDDGLRKIYVEIYSKADKDITINVREFIDPRLKVVLSSTHGYVLSTIDEISLYKLGILEDIESLDSIDYTTFDNDYIRINYKKFKINLNKNNIFEINRWEDLSSCLIWFMDSNNTINCSRLKEITNNDTIYLNDLPNLNNFLNIYYNGSGTGVNDTYLIRRGDKNCFNINLCGVTTARICEPQRGYLEEHTASLRLSDGLTHHMKCLNNNSILAISPPLLVINDVTIKPGSLFAYWYYVKPLTRGAYKVETIADSSVPGSVTPAYVSLSIDNQPKFAVTSKVTQSKIYRNEVIPIQYVVKYLGGGNNREYVSVMLDRNASYEYVDRSGYLDTTLNFLDVFYINESKTIKKFIRFKDVGIVLAPGITVNNENFSSELVTIDNKFSRDPLMWTQLFILITTIMVTILLVNIFMYSEPQKEKANYLLSKNNYFGLKLIVFFYFIIIGLTYLWIS